MHQVRQSICSALTLIFPWAVLAWSCPPAPKSKSAGRAGQFPKKIIQVQELLGQPINHPKHEQMPLAKFLQTLEGLLPKDNKVSFRLDEALGKELPQIAKTPIKFPKLIGVSLRTGLR